MADRTELAERAVGVLVTFALFQGISRAAVGISSPGTAAAGLAVASTAVCQGDSAVVCKVGRVVNAPGNLVGKGVVTLGEKAVDAIRGRGALPSPA